MALKLNKLTSTSIPTRWVGPIEVLGQYAHGAYHVPMATFETTLWPSTQRGAKVTALSGGIRTVLDQDSMARSITLEAPNALEAFESKQWILQSLPSITTLLANQSRYARLQNIHIEVVGRLLFIRLSIHSGEASGHNMVTKAADHLIQWLQKEKPHLSYVSISGNMCVDKKVSAINGILGRGKRVIAECHIPREVCIQHLRVTPEGFEALNLKKNLIGSNIAGSIRSANSHFANILLATYLATGQDAANIVEGSQGIVCAEATDDGLYMSVTLPNIIVGTIGNGKHHDFVHERLEKILGQAPKKNSARALAEVIASTVLCGELSCLAAQCNQGELMRSHDYYERKHRVTSTGEKKC